MKMKKVLLFVILSFCDGAKILGVFNHPGASHTFLGKTLLRNLARRGHEIIMISSFPLEKPINNYKDIALPGLLEDLRAREMMYFKKDTFKSFNELENMTLQHTEDTFKEPQVQNLLESNQTFDVVISDWFFNDANLIFGHIFNAPVIYMSSFGNNVMINYLTGTSLPWSYVPGAAIFTDDNISFKHRILLTLMNLANDFYIIPKRRKAHNKILQRHFHNIPSVEELEENVALVLSNSHFSFETPRPYTPAIIPIGGFHLQEQSETMSSELKNFLDSGKEGVIYFSLGSQIKSSNIDREKMEIILTVFGELRQKVLWKYEQDDLGHLASNIKVVKWAPQLDILGHSNVKVFISHGGVLSFIEALYFGVPTLCMPFNGDQNANAAFIQSRGIGAALSLENLDANNFRTILQDLLENPKYRMKATFHSQLLRNQPIKPLDLAIWWVEHVIKFKSGKHLKCFATKLPWYTYYMIDVIVVVTAVTFVAVKLIFVVMKIVIKYMCYERNVKLKKKL